MQGEAIVLRVLVNLQAMQALASKRISELSHIGKTLRCAAPDSRNSATRSEMKHERNEAPRATTLVTPPRTRQPRAAVESDALLDFTHLHTAPHRPKLTQSAAQCTSFQGQELRARDLSAVLFPLFQQTSLLLKKPLFASLKKCKMQGR